MTVVDSADITSDPFTKFIRPQPRIHDQRVTLHHWQLRDLVLQPDGPQFKHELVVPVEHDVLRYDTRSGRRRFLAKGLGYIPTCMAAGHGYWAAGGQRSDLTLKDLNSDYEVSVTTSPSNTINNGLCFSKVQDEIRLIVSNNDSTVRIYSIPHLRLLHTLDFNVAVNHTSVSPDGQKMVVVGDDKKVHLFAITSGGNYERVSTMTAAKDANFSVSWTSNSERFAVASQDGSVHVWDLRHRDPLCRLAGVGNASITKGAIRCVKFTKSRAVDLLAYTEHVSHVHIVDARTFDAQQTLRVGPAGQDTPITGLTFSQDSENMFVGLDNAILEYGVDTGSRRRFPQGALL
ncbi:WD40-repeat-containing domain protein [Dichotomocladium elegans]|nr:WD40-repeat-containing domain protein [Dichotomocladium elegans]